MSRKDAKKYVLDADTGEYAYTGKRFVVAADEKCLKQLKIFGMLLSVAATALFISGGMFLHGGFNDWYELSPYALQIIPVAWLFSRMIKLLPKSDELTEAGANIFSGIKTSGIALVILGVLAAIGQTAHIIMSGLADGDILFIAVMLLVSVCGAGVFVLARRCPIEPFYIGETDEK